jgi:hypothetical protein
MRNLDELCLGFTRMDCSSKCFTQLALPARKTKSLSFINQAFAAAKEVINRWGSDIARLGEISYAHCTLTTFIDCCSGCLEQSFTSGIYLSHKEILVKNFHSAVLLRKL